MTWLPGPGADITGVQFPSDGTPSNCDVTLMAIPNGIIPIQPGDGLRGMLDGWDAQVDVVDPNNLAAGSFTLIAGTIGSVAEDSNGLLMIAINGPLAQSKASITEHYSITAREVLGDDRCKIPILPADIGRNQPYITNDPAPPGLLTVSSCYGRFRTGSAGTVEDYANVYYQCIVDGITGAIAPEYDPTVGSITIDGTAQFQAMNSWLRYARGQAINPYTVQLAYSPDSRATSDDTWFAPFCNLYVRSGPLVNTRIPVNAWTSASLLVSLAMPIAPSDFPENTQFEIHRGCNLTANICNTIFNNIVNRRGEEFVSPDLVGSFSTP